MSFARVLCRTGLLFLLFSLVLLHGGCPDRGQGVQPDRFVGRWMRHPRGMAPPIYDLCADGSYRSSWPGRGSTKVEEGTWTVGPSSLRLEASETGKTSTLNIEGDALIYCHEEGCRVHSVFRRREGEVASTCR